MTSTERLQPLRTALIGLSSSPTGYGWLNHFHMPAIHHHSSHFKVCAVLGSSQDHAKKAIEKHNLGSDISAYGSPEALARDDEVEFIVVGVKAPLHKDVLMPSLLRAKEPGRERLQGVFVERPIGRSLHETEEIVHLARSLRLKTAVGLQGLYSSVGRHVWALLPRIGNRILSTTITGTLPTGNGKSEKAGSRYALDPANGATIVDIHLAHLMEFMSFALSVDFASVSALVSTIHQTTNIFDNSTDEILETDVPKPSPDHIALHGLLRRKRHGSFLPNHDEHNAKEHKYPYSISLRSGNSIHNGMTWLIEGDKGELEITSSVHAIPHINVPEVPWKIRIKAEGNKDIFEESVIEDEGGQPAVSRLWNAFVAGDTDSWPDFEHALKLHRIVDAVWRSSREGRVIEL